MHRLVSPFILDRYAAGEASGQFEAAALFVDMSGFSAMTSKLMEHGQHGAEVLATVMRAIFDPLVAAVYGHGGFITVFAGDAFTAVFPAAQDLSGFRRPDRSALAAAWTMREHMCAHPSHTTPYGAFTVSAKVGLAVGDVDWGIIRSEDDTRAAFYFRGPAVDACAAAEQRAQRDELVLHPSAQAALADHVDGELADGYLRVTDLTGAQPLPQPQPVNLPAPAPDLQARFFPRDISAQTQAGEFRQAINVFVGLQGDPTPAQVAAVVQCVFDLQAKYGGLLNRVDFGDKGCGLLLFWGAPVAHENDVVRALNFLLELHDRTHIPIRAGVTSRISHAGFIGSSLHEEYTCYGIGVNLAARLMTSAPWEGIWLDDEVRLRVEHQFELVEEGQRLFKGFAEPQAVYSLLGYRAANTLDFYERKLVGRQAELARLAAFLAPLAERRYAGVLVVTGEPGIGKSRLVHEFLFAQPCLTAETCQVLIAQTDSILRQALNPFRYWLRDYFGVAATQSEAYNKRVFGRKLALLEAATTDAALREDLERGRSFLGALLDLSWEDSAHARADAEARYENTLSALKALILAESLRQPTTLVVEDAHWLDEDSRQFMARLVRNIERYPLAILATARPEQEGVLFGPDLSYQTLALTDLAADDLATLTAEILDGPVSPELLALLMERSSGNPFFAEQIVLYLRDAGLLARVNGAWAPSQAAMAAAPLPTNVRAFFIARLDRLAHEVREVVQTAAVLGREFEVTVLSQMLQHEGVYPHVAAASQAAIWSALTEIRYLFKHVLLRDAAYDMQVRTRRAELHQLAGYALETVYAEDLPAHYGELAYHYEAAHQAGLVATREKARDYLEQAGAQAGERFENAIAADYLTRALTLTSEDALAQRFDLLIARQKLNGRRGLRDAQAEDITVAEALAEALNDDLRRARTALWRARYAEDTGDFQTALAAGQRCAALAQAAGDVTLEADGHSQWADALYRQSEFQASIERNEVGLAIARAHGLRPQEGDMLNGIAFALDSLGRYAEATAVCHEALAIFRELGDAGAEGGVLNSLGILAFETGDFSEARRLFEQALAIARSHGKIIAVSRYLANLGETLMRLGNLSAAHDTLSDAIRIFREIGNREGEAIGLSGQGVLYTKLGDFEQAQRAFERAIELSRELGAPLVDCEALAYYSLLSVHRGDYATARAQAEASIVLARDLGAQRQEGIALHSLGHALIGLGDLSAARSSFRAAADLREALGEIPPAIESRAGLVWALLSAGDMDAARAEMAHVRHLIAEQQPGADEFGLEGLEDPLWAQWIWQQTQVAAGDPRATGALEKAYALLQARADQFTDAAERQRFLNNIAYHRDIITAHEAATGEQPTALEPVTTESTAAVDLSSGDLAHASNQRSDAGANLRGRNLRGADLNRADLRGTDLAGAELRGADLTYADLRGVDLTGADLRGADLTGADLRGADLMSAQLRGADLTDAVWDERTHWPEGFEPDVEA